MAGIIALTERGHRVGESHGNAKLSDEQVDKMRELREQKGFSYGKLAMLFKTSKFTVRSICTYQRRALTAARWKRV